MHFYNWLMNLRKTVSLQGFGRRSRRVQRRSPSASCEVLEDRRMLSSLAFGVQAGTDSLYVVNLDTGKGAMIGPLHPDVDRFTTPVAMAVRPSDGTIFVNNNSPDSDIGLATVDPATGLATLIGGGFSGALAFDNQNNLYSIDNDRGFGGPLAIVNQMTGGATSLGGPALPPIYGLDFNSADGLLYGITGFGEELDLLVIDPGDGSLLATRRLVTSTFLGLSTPGTLYFDASGTLHGAIMGKIFEIDPATGVVSNIQGLRFPFSPQGLGSTIGFQGNFRPDAVDDIKTTHEDASAIIDVLRNDCDVDGVSLNVTTITQPAHGSVVINSDGTVTYTPDADYFGPDVFTYSIDDGNGGIDTASVNINVIPVNDAPAFDLRGNLMVPEDAGPQTVSAFATSINVGAANETGQSLMFLVTSDNDALFSTLPTIDNSSGELSYTTAVDANGTAILTVVLMDDGGTENGGIDKSDPQTFVISVLSPAEQITNLVDQIQIHVDDGVLNPGQGNALTKKLEHIGERLDAGQTNPAVNNLKAFTNQVSALIESGVLTPQEGQSLLRAAEDLRISIETTNAETLDLAFADESLLDDLLSAIGELLGT